MHGCIARAAAFGLVVALTATTPAFGSDWSWNISSTPAPDPGYTSVAKVPQFQPISSTSSLAGIEARLSVLEATMAERKEEEEPLWTEVGN